MDFFFYGTLLDPAVRRLVLGAGAGRLRLEPARLAGYRRCAQRAETAPVILRRAGGLVRGLLCRGLDARALARLEHFEGAGYRRVSLKVRQGRGRSRRAFAFIGAERGAAPVRSWRFDIWRRRHKRAFLARMVAWMAAYRETDGRAQSSPPPSVILD
jgi:hypothetical protein